VRWTVISLLLFNIIFLLWNWLEYSHSKKVEALNVSVEGAHVEMPGAKVVLLSERSVPVGQAAIVGAIDAADSAAAQPSVTPPVAGDAASVDQESRQCLLLGPYPDPQAARALLERLASLQIEAKYSAVEVAGEPDYWVYLRPEPTKELAAVKLRELQEKKIDSFIIPQGEIANGISLGVFDKQENAEKRRQSIVEMGYNPQLRINPRNYIENWVVIYPEHSALFSPELYNQLHLENNKLDLRKDQCNKVASQIDIH
jgi:hypothetical protein